MLFGVLQISLEAGCYLGPGGPFLCTASGHMGVTPATDIWLCCPLQHWCSPLSSAPVGGFIAAWLCLAELPLGGPQDTLLIIRTPPLQWVPDLASLTEGAAPFTTGELPVMIYTPLPKQERIWGPQDTTSVWQRSNSLYQYVLQSQQQEGCRPERHVP
ncbi:hypothetical protein NDU88_009534 [Pleurodeles waltl]|uniref:Uncharacterized protein n=1 Tax=Pleurodeles waltl TaxID=8319 RepID=A0AAV7NZD4_PLEWA|nr:hypothetical protein NDU88_009534 [Pleurodeles waltl]